MMLPTFMFIMFLDNKIRLLGQSTMLVSVKLLFLTSRYDFYIQKS